MLDTLKRNRIAQRLAPIAIFSVALVFFLINLDRPPHPDELHHILAAQHLLETGRPIIAEGEYWRVVLHTWMVAVSYEIFGDSLVSARLPAVLLVALVAPVLFLWVRREAGSLAALLTAVLFISSPFTVEIAQFSRFYGLQMFSLVMGTVCIYYAVVGSQSIPLRVVLAVVAMAFVLLAISAQVTTLVGLVGVAVWLFGLVMRRVYFHPSTTRIVKLATTVALISAVIISLLLLTGTELLQWAWRRHQFTPLFNAEIEDDYWFYFVRFFLFYPTLWTLIGVFAVLAVIRSPRLAWLAISIFGISFVLMSVAGSKATRYLSFATPYLAILWGVGLASAIPALRRFMDEMKPRLTESLALSPRPANVLGNTFLILALVIVLLANPFWLRTATMIANVPLPMETPATDWPKAKEALASWVQDAEIMITTEELGAIYFLGRSDVRFSPSKLRELAEDQEKEFGIDHRTGRPIISTPESVERLIRCFSSGFVVGPSEHWGMPILISEQVQAVLYEYAEPIEVPNDSHLYAWGWRRSSYEPRPADCAQLDHFSPRITAQDQ